MNAPAKKRIFKKLGLSVKKSLGCGGFGTIYETDNPYWIIKITRSTSEVAGIRQILKAQRTGTRFGALPFYRNLLKFNNRYLIVRERLDCHLEPNDEIVLAACSLFSSNRKVSKTKKRLLKEYFPEAIKSNRELKKIDMRLYDVRNDNFGISKYNKPWRKKGSIVLLDFETNSNDDYRRLKSLRTL